MGRAKGIGLQNVSSRQLLLLSRFLVVHALRARIVQRERGAGMPSVPRRDSRRGRKRHVHALRARPLLGRLPGRVCDNVSRGYGGLFCMGSGEPHARSIGLS